MKKVIRKKADKHFVLVDERIVEYFGKKYKSAYFLECDKDGNISDGNKDGIISNETITCKIPNGKEDIDLSTLSEDCLE